MATIPNPEIDEEAVIEQPIRYRNSKSSEAASNFWRSFEDNLAHDDFRRRARVIRAAQRYAGRRQSGRERVYEFLKRVVDLMVATPLLIAGFPILFLIGLATKFYDGGPMFFRQVRIGRFGKPFSCYKIRTMVPNADSIKWKVQELNHHTDGITFKSALDPRITPLGAWLRKTSLDELPQLLNIFLGHMSLVGPRPAVPSEVIKYKGSDYQRLLVTPGLTCIWQVSGRGDIDFDGQVSMDLEYVRRRSPWLDTKLLFQTIPAVLSMRGAY